MKSLKKMFWFGWQPQERTVFCKTVVWACYGCSSAVYFVWTEED